MVDVRYISVSDFAKRMDLHVDTVMRMIKRGKIQAADVGTGSKPMYRIPETEVDLLLAKGTVEILKDIIKDEMEKKNEPK